MVGDGEDAAEVVGGVAPFGGEPGVVVVEPADDAADVPGGLDRVEAEGGAGYARAIGDLGAFNDGAQVLGALGEAQRQQAAAQGVHQAVAGCVEGFRAFDAVVEDVVGGFLDDLVVVRADVGFYVGAHDGFL